MYFALMFQGMNTGILNRVKDAGIGIFLHLAHGGDDVRVADSHTNAPARHIEEFGEGV